MSEAAIGPAEKVRGFAERFGAAPYMATVFLSAALVFLVQPMFAKMATPLLGGAPNVWNVSLVCFQAALLIGYAYAHTLTHFVRSLRTQVAIHGALLLVAALVLPFQLSGALGQPDPTQPTLWLIGVFALSIAPPFAVISATAPLIQRWYSFTGRDDAHDPYHLYGASNIGSLLGLAAYPLLLEPLLPVAAQAQAWTVGYLALVGLLMLSGLAAIRSRAAFVPASGEAISESVEASTSARWKQRVWWITLAFIPSSLLVGVTTHIATDVASAPFLWAPPLMLYIGTFIIVFAKRPPIRTETALRYLPLAVAAATLALPSVSGMPLILSFALHLAVLFLAALACHGLLAQDRPEPSRLTEFYLLMSLGGVLGGAFNALLVPVIFNAVTEYPLMLLAVLLVRPEEQWIGKGRIRFWLVLAIGALVASIALRATLSVDDSGIAVIFRLLLAAALLGVILGRNSRLIPVLCAASAWIIGMVAHPVAGGFSERGFFGVVKVVEKGDHRLMMHGTTLHGAQYLTETDRLRPTTYYAPEAPIGQVFAQHDAPGRVGVVGLGTGSVACYARPGQQYTYYEIDPLVAKFASDPKYFSYLSDCTPNPDIVLGDGRLTLAAEPEAAFNLLLIDAFSSDSVPAHLLTREAVALYLSRLSEDGVLVMHVSNNHMALTDVVTRIARDLNVPTLYQFYSSPVAQGDDQFRSQASQVVLLARTEGALDRFVEDRRWTVRDVDDGRAWTDDYSNVIGAILEHKF